MELLFFHVHETPPRGLHKLEIVSCGHAVVYPSAFALTDRFTKASPCFFHGKMAQEGNFMPLPVLCCIIIIVLHIIYLIYSFS